MQLSKSQTIRFLFKASRPRFWLYLAGPYLIGIGTQTDFSSLYGLFYFLIPANIFLYGVNDLFDIETDKLNAKKSHKEDYVSSGAKKRVLTIAVIGSLLAGIPLLMTSQLSQMLFITFLLLSFFYSAHPIRFKARPFLDFLSNSLYILPGLIGYLNVTGRLPEMKFILAGMAWAWAMHLFSAIPDIQPDKKAGITTTAVHLGKNSSLLLCSVLWGIATYFVTHVSLLFYIGMGYAFIPLILSFQNTNSKGITRVYWMFPYLNAIVGFSLFLMRIS